MAVITRFDLDVSKMTRQGGCCTYVIVHNEIQIHQQKNGERPKAALLFWFFGDFRCGALLFMVIHVIYKYKNK